MTAENAEGPPVGTDGPSETSLLASNNETIDRKPANRSVECRPRHLLRHQPA